MSFYEVIRAGESETTQFCQLREAANAQLNAARNMCDAVAGQDYRVQAAATDDLLDAIAIASEWGLVRQGTKPGGNGRALP